MADCGINNQHYKNVNLQQIKDGRKKAWKLYPRSQSNRYLRNILERVTEGEMTVNFYYISINVPTGLCGQ